MAARKTTGPGAKLQLAERRRKTAALRRKGWTQRRIAEEVGVSQRVISRDLDIIDQDLNREAKEDIAAVRRMAHIRLEYLWEENVDAWERSIGDQDTKTMKEDGESTEKVLRSQSSPGDPRFLHNAERVVARIVDLHQAGGPKQLNINDISKRPTDQLLERLTTLIPGAAELLGASGSGSTSGGAGSTADDAPAGDGEPDETEDGE